MPLYFAYGANMDRAAMQKRCPKSPPLGRARLMGHRFVIMVSGHGSVKRDLQREVHGVLYDLAFADIPALDRYEDIARGLYRKITQPVLREGAGPMKALLYVGVASEEGEARGDYLDHVVAAARSWALPETYITYLGSLGGRPIPAAPIGRRAIKLKDVGA